MPNIDESVNILKKCIIDYIGILNYYRRFSVVADQVLSPNYFNMTKRIFEIQLRDVNNRDRDIDELKLEDVKIVITKENLDKIPLIKYNNEKISSDLRE
jgi:beta-glucosidase/6-phospho-beta-glucosidase/beta-galactosidase